MNQQLLLAALSITLASLNFCSLQGIERELIESFDINHNSLEVVINKSLKERYLKDNFFAEYDEDIDLNRLDTSLVLIPFLSNIMTVVWISGKDYYVDVMDEDFYYSSLELKKILQRLYPLTPWKGNLIPRTLIKNNGIVPLKDPNKEIALLFSGGLDSTASSYSHLDKKQHLITMWGQWDVPLRKPALWQKRKDYFENYAKKHGYTNSFVKSNYVDFLNWDVLDSLSPEITTWRVDTTEGMGMMGLAFPIMILNGYPRLVIGSSYQWDYPYPTSANPYSDHKLLIASNFHLMHDQFDFSRQDKLALIAHTIDKTGAPYPYLKVCNGQTSSNCCKSCSKCIPTILGLLALKENPKNYGFSISTDKIAANTHEFFSKMHDHDTMWHIVKTKKFLQKHSKNAEDGTPLMNWLLQQDLKKITNTGTMRHLTKVDWKKFEPNYPVVFQPELHKTSFNFVEEKQKNKAVENELQSHISIAQPQNSSPKQEEQPALLEKHMLEDEAHSGSVWQTVKNYIVSWLGNEK